MLNLSAYFGQSWKEFTDLHPRHVGGDWIEFSPEFTGCMGFEVKCVYV